MVAGGGNAATPRRLCYAPRNDVEDRGFSVERGAIPGPIEGKTYGRDSLLSYLPPTPFFPPLLSAVLRSPLPAAQANAPTRLCSPPPAAWEP